RLALDDIEHQQILIFDRFDGDSPAIEGRSGYRAAALAELLHRSAGNGERESMILRVGIHNPTAVPGDLGVYDLERAGEKGPLPAGVEVPPLQRPMTESLAYK